MAIQMKCAKCGEKLPANKRPKAASLPVRDLKGGKRLILFYFCEDCFKKLPPKGKERDSELAKLFVLKKGVLS